MHDTTHQARRTKMCWISATKQWISDGPKYAVQQFWPNSDEQNYFWLRKIHVITLGGRCQGRDDGQARLPTYSSQTRHRQAANYYISTRIFSFNVLRPQKIRGGGGTVPVMCWWLCFYLAYVHALLSVDGVNIVLMLCNSVNNAVC